MTRSLRIGCSHSATTFTVDAFPGERFNGAVRQIRNAATMVQNVVTYDAVIDVGRPICQRWATRARRARSLR